MVQADSEGYLLLPALNIKITAHGQRLIFVDTVSGERLRDTGESSRAIRNMHKITSTMSHQT